MGRKLDIKQAVKATGLSEYYLRKGVNEGRYPHKRMKPKGKIIFDESLLNEAIEKEMMENIDQL